MSDTNETDTSEDLAPRHHAAAGDEKSTAADVASGIADFLDVDPPESPADQSDAAAP